MEEKISLKELFNVLKKRLIMIIIVTLIFGIAAGLISKVFLTPIYESSTQLLVNQKETDSSSIYQNNQVQTNIQLINTYNVIIKSPSILDDVIQRMNLDYTAKELNEKITVVSQKDSQVFAVTVQDPDPEQARDIANTVAYVFTKKIGHIMSVNNISVLARAEISEHPDPIKPNTKLNTLIGLLVGLMLSVGVAFLLDYLDNTIKNQKELEDLLGLPVLGIISHMDEDNLIPQPKKSILSRIRKGGKGV